MLTKKDFNDQYWFSPLQMITVKNPRPEDYRFMVEMRSFIVKGGGTEQMPGQVANVYLSHLTKELAQDDNRLEFLSDVNLMKQYYDSLIIDVVSLMPEDKSEPAYLTQVPDTMRATKAETPPWQNKTEEVVPVEEPVAVKPKEEVKEFEQGEDKYKMIVAKTGKKMFYKNSALTTEAEYSRAASLL